LRRSDQKKQLKKIGAQLQVKGGKKAETMKENRRIRALGEYWKKKRPAARDFTYRNTENQNGVQAVWNENSARKEKPNHNEHPKKNPQNLPTPHRPFRKKKSQKPLPLT